MFSVRRHKLLSFVLSLWLVTGLVACGKKKGAAAETDAAKPETKTTKPQSAEQLSALRDRACRVFLGAVDDALQLHLTRTPSERGGLLAEGYSVAFELFLEEYVSDELARASAREKLNESFESIADCSPYLAVAAALQTDEAAQAVILLQFLSVSLNATLRAMDPFSHYAASGGEWIRGVGIQFLTRTDYDLGRSPKYLVVDRILPSSPNLGLEKDRSLRPGSCIHSIGGKGVSTLGYDDALTQLNPNGRKSPKEIAVEVEDPPCSGSGPRRSFKLKIDRYEPIVARFSWEDEASGIGRLRLSDFSSQSFNDIQNEWISAIQDLLKKRSGPLRGLILDLRSNGGGYVLQAERLLELLLPRDSVLFRSQEIVANPGDADGTFGEKPTQMTTNKSDQEKSWVGLETLLVLVDRGTASASEVVAAALRDYRRAVVVGERTYGKGIGQGGVLVRWPLTGIMFVSNQLSFSPKGISHQIQGIVPDIEIVDPVTEFQYQKEKKPYRMGEHLNADGGKETIVPKPEDLKVSERLEPVPEEERVSDTLVAQLKKAKQQMATPPSCRKNPTQPGFREQDDCLLAWGTKLLREMIALKGISE
ncbi:MAG: S41 family peptidase [Pseudomonadota bacterium]